jgi:3-deoxy-D-manno-octulosonate 8-phosphate phosphatase (KDO 8-P phosphatase)
MQPSEVQNLFEQVGGEWLSSPSLILERLQNIRAFVFDWDGVFNDGVKFGTQGSPFSEVDSMGTNMLRFGYYLQHGVLPAVAVITGEHNPSAVFWAGREHVASLYSRSADKRVSLEHFCATNGLSPSEVIYFFDDVLDIPVAALAGIRVMIGRKGSPMFTSYVKKHSFADYITGAGGGHGAVREGCELLLGLMGMYDRAIHSRAAYSAEYSRYIALRNDNPCRYWIYTSEGILPDQTI